MGMWRLQTTVQHWLAQVTRVPGLAGLSGLGGASGLPDWQALAGETRLEAWEAELTAYARWRTGHPALKVRFGLATGTTWGEEVVLARPGRRLAPQAALAQAECELEHLLAHHRYGWREVALLWQVWAEPSAAVVLPWAPWDAVPLPPAVLRQALAATHPALQLPPGWEGAGARQRGAAVWLTGAWADGRHRALAVGERPGLAQRLPTPEGFGRGGLWESVLGRLATGGPGESGESGDPGKDGPRGGPEGDVGRAVQRLLEVETQDAAAQVQGVLNLVEALGRRGALPPAHKQRPPWLRRPWGRWRRESALREALDRLARSPTSAAVAVATAAGRRHTGPGAGRRGGAGGSLAAPGALGRPETETSGDPPAVALQDDRDEQEGRPPTDPEWGLRPEEALPQRTPGAELDRAATGREGQGSAGAGGAGAGAGVLGALHVVRAQPADRAAYWQLRGALAPEIERLTAGLREASGEYFHSVPRRFQRAGRLDRSRLPAAVAGREAVFVRVQPRPLPEHALCLLLDCSASMTVRAEALRQTAIVVEAAAAAVGARVSAFTFGAAWERLEPPAAGAPLVALGRELRPHGGTPFGPAVAAAAAWLGRQPYTRRRLWVLSDGQWSARDRAAAAGRPDLLRDVLVWVMGAGFGGAPGNASGSAPGGASGGGAPPFVSPSPYLNVAAVDSLHELVRQAPARYWPTPWAA